MEVFKELFLPVLYAFLGCGGFSVLYNIHSPSGVLMCAFGGGLGWLVYLLSAPLLRGDIAQTLVAAMVVSLYAEGMARLCKRPATGYQLISLVPMVPGGGIYYTMEHAINGETELFLASFLHTLGIAGALAVGVLFVSSAFRVWGNFRHRQKGACP